MHSVHPQLLFHYTCEMHLGSIMRSGMLDVTGSNVNHIPVVWMTSNPTPESLGVGVPGGTLKEFDKTRYRFTIAWHPHIEKWSDWCDRYSVPEEMRAIMGETAGEIDTQDSWYVSEQPVYMNQWRSIDNLATGKHLWEP